ncbi:MAG: hypothetical protein PHU26_04735 [Methanofollis liminatans]|jgi:hypothetical protein|uniref:Uncharacterized protein n=3 Tax=Methanofollis TaxID=81416 RepID=A0A7K4HQG0_9EURY|nr:MULTISPECIES: hypothetical protein [Methanofollis]EJG07911.1 hypothetical protein Metli_1968 [Methanofollis liminatans DSM 4140]MDD3111583.1 hypothetical protein [Methanofollis liminatans]NVO67503.1 hypothetical protein [Methanofollis tationis]HDS63451.1 hypothetical protein [Methanofollis liminatans]
MDAFDMGGILLIILGIVIVLQLFIMYIMYVRIQQLLSEVDVLGSRMRITDSELEALTKNVEKFKQLRI